MKGETIIKIYVVDSIMGSGKTSAAINKMNEDIHSNYIFITPFLKEVDRIKESCSFRRFVEPENKGEGKLESLHYLIGKGYNIASTHALFKAYNDYTKELIRNNNYKLILDEVFNVLEHIPLHKDDIKLMFEKGLAHTDEDNYVIWDDDTYDGNRFRDIKQMAKNHNLLLIDNTLLLWNFPVDIFESFQEVYILTYMFNAQIQKYYYDINNVELKYMGVEFKNSEYKFSDSGNTPEYIHTLINKIDIIEDEKLNYIGDTEYSLSASWFDREIDKRNKPLIKNLKNNLINVYKNKFKSSSEENMWTTYKDAQQYLSGKGYTKGFVSVNARATNEYRDRKYLSYCANIFFNPYLKHYFINKGVNVLESKYALSELIQWIWRSAIRDGNNISIYIPSNRMRNMLIEWLNNLNDKEESNE
jgi:hypothetical protein